MSRSRKVTRFEVHDGVYKDSLVLMQLQSRLLGEPGVLEAGATMASSANLELLAAGGLLPEEAGSSLRAEDLLVVVRAESSQAADAALARVTDLLASRDSGGAGSFRPRSLDGAISQLPDAKWALVSVPGQQAPRVTEDALDRGLNVFLYSDNVSGSEEERLKRLAGRRGLMVLGPDCGTAIIGGIGFGFANHVRRGSIGLVGGSGTGLQAVSVAIHALGAGVSQAIGTGGHDLSAEVGGLATRQALQVLADDPDTEVIALISKSPGREVAERALGWAAACGKPVVAYLQGFVANDRDASNQSGQGLLHLASSLSDAARVAVRLATPSATPTRILNEEPAMVEPPGGATTGGFIRGLFAGGTLAAEVLLQLHGRIAPLYSNLQGDWRRLDDARVSRENTIVDLGADEFTRGRLHPMVDQQPRLERLRHEATMPDVSVILLDVVLGEGAHPDPASVLAPAIEDARRIATVEGRLLQIVAIVIGTDEDPQDLERQVELLTAAGAIVVSSIEEAVAHVAAVCEMDEPAEPTPHLRTPLDTEATPSVAAIEPIPAASFTPPIDTINIGLESFYASLLSQGAAAVQVDWRPPAGGNERMAAILDRLRETRTSMTETPAP